MRHLLLRNHAGENLRVQAVNSQEKKFSLGRGCATAAGAQDEKEEYLLRQGMLGETGRGPQCSPSLLREQSITVVPH